MKKILLFLTLTFAFFLTGITTVEAKTDQFYEAEYIDGIYMVRDDGTTKYYQKARFFRRIGDDRAGYCMQPFALFAPNTIYSGVTTPTLYADVRWERITDIAGFGYGYQDHTDPKWYAITQLMLWETVEPNSTFYFTDTLNGNRINALQSEREEIERLIADSKKVPSFFGNTYYGIVGKGVTLTDENNILSQFQSITNMASINGNTITLTNNSEGYHEYMLKSTYRNQDDPIYFYYSGNGDSQQIMTTGKPLPIKAYFKVCFLKLKLLLQKIDRDTQSIKSLGEASLEGTTFTLYDKDHNKVTDITFDKDMKATIIGEGENSLLDFGTYYLQETKQGVGYQKDETTYTLNFSVDQPTIELKLENEVIKGNLIIEKSYGDHQIMQSEENVSFEIYDKENKLVDTITTDQNGKTAITLPYGHYTVKQISTTEGYTKVEPFKIFINEKKDYLFRIYDYKEGTKKEEIITVNVPDTYTEDNVLAALGGYYLAQKTMD